MFFDAPDHCANFVCLLFVFICIVVRIGEINYLSIYLLPLLPGTPLKNLSVHSYKPFIRPILTYVFPGCFSFTFPTPITFVKRSTDPLIEHYRLSAINSDSSPTIKSTFPHCLSLIDLSLTSNVL